MANPNDRLAMAFREDTRAQVEAGRTRAELRGCLGAMVGSVISIKGYPSSEVRTTQERDADGTLRREIVEIDAQQAIERGLVSLAGVALLSVSAMPDMLLVAVVPPEDVEALASMPEQCQAYWFPLGGTSITDLSGA